MSCIKKLLLSVICLFFYSISGVLQATENAPYLYILGVTQDAGYPQAGCYKPHCMRGWLNPELRRLATSFGLIDPLSKQDYLFEATPDIKQQLYQMHSVTGALQHKLNGIFLTHAHIGHYTGLMYFGHEVMGSKNIPVYSLPRMAKFLSENGPWSQLVDFKNILLKPMLEQVPVTLNKQLQVVAFKVPHRDEFSETAGFKIIGPNKSALFIPDINKWHLWSVDLAEQISKADYALIDATFYAQGELPGRDMSKIPHPLVTDTMELLKQLKPEQRAKVYFIHFNHTNPLLDDGSEQVKNVQSKGFNIAREGLKLGL